MGITKFVKSYKCKPDGCVDIAMNLGAPFTSTQKQIVFHDIKHHTTGFSYCTFDIILLKTLVISLVFVPAQRASALLRARQIDHSRVVMVRVLMHDQQYIVNMEFIKILGLVAGICTSSSVIPQLIKTVKEKKAADISWAMFAVLITGNSLWIYYGIDKGDIPIIATNILALVLNIMMLVFKWKY